MYQGFCRYVKGLKNIFKFKNGDLNFNAKFAADKDSGCKIFYLIIYYYAQLYQNVNVNTVFCYVLSYTFNYVNNC